MQLDSNQIINLEIIISLGNLFLNIMWTYKYENRFNIHVVFTKQSNNKNTLVVYSNYSYYLFIKVRDVFTPVDDNTVVEIPYSYIIDIAFGVLSLSTMVEMTTDKRKWK